MVIHLVTADSELANLCRKILAGWPELDHSWTLTLVSGSEAWSKADLYICDFHPDLPLPENLNLNPLRCLFLVDRKHLAAFHECTGASEANVLLKPVTRATLTTFLGPAISNGATKSLRADRDEILQCLIQTNLKLQEYDQDRTTFLVRAVHDFRAPLTALSGYCGLLLAEPLGPLSDNQKEVLRRMQHSAKRLSRMAAAMFELGAGRHVKRCSCYYPGDLRECLDQAIHEIALFADEKNISIASDLAPGVDVTHFDASQIEQVLLNILDNACKFTPKNGAIEIRGYPFFWERRKHHTRIDSSQEQRHRDTHEPNSYRIDVSDTGSPIPAEHLEPIFEEYTSYSGGRDRSGGGLGLAICKVIITQHGGRIWAENRDSGPLFSFVLPTRRTEAGYANENPDPRCVASKGT